MLKICEGLNPSATYVTWGIVCDNGNEIMLSGDRLKLPQYSVGKVMSYEFAMVYLRNGEILNVVSGGSADMRVDMNINNHGIIVESNAHCKRFSPGTAIMPIYRGKLSIYTPVMVSHDDAADGVVIPEGFVVDYVSEVSTSVNLADLAGVCIYGEVQGGNRVKVFGLDAQKVPFFVDSDTDDIFQLDYGKVVKSFGMDFMAYRTQVLANGNKVVFPDTNKEVLIKDVTPDTSYSLTYPSMFPTESGLKYLYPYKPDGSPIFVVDGAAIPYKEKSTGEMISELFSGAPSVFKGIDKTVDNALRLALVYKAASMC